MIKIGLFPLNLVLFPESIIPLHIFEERYKELINRCVDDNNVFGINLAAPKMQKIGCTAEVLDVMKKYEDGKMDIIITGRQRFELKHFYDGEESFYVGEVEIIEESEEKIDPELLKTCVEHFNKIISSLEELKIDHIDPVKFKNQYPSYYLAAKSGFTVDQRQELLEINSENRRLRYIYEHLTKVMPLIKEADRINRVIKNDGFFNREI